MKILYGNLANFSKADYNAEYSSLPDCLRKRIDRIRKSEDKKRSLAGKILLKKLLLEEYGIKDPIIEYTQKGAPYLKNSDLKISIAHSYDGIAVAADETQVGIDIEKIRDIDLALCKKVCTEREDEYIFSANTRDEGILRFFEVWTAKEAYFKKQGTGIVDLKSVCIFDLDRRVEIKDGYMIQTVK